MMKKIMVWLAAGFVVCATSAQPQAKVSVDQFEGFSVHTYASFDPMADVSFIVESPNRLVVIEPQAFHGKLEEFRAYAQQLGKPIEKVLVSFHAAGLTVYSDEIKAITKPMAEFMASDQGKGMLAHFDQRFGGAMDTERVAFDELLEATAAFEIDGVSYELEPSSLPGMPGVNIAIGGQVFYQHFVPAKGHHVSPQIASEAAIAGALIDALKAKVAGYTLLLGSHGTGRARAADLDFQIGYLQAMRQIAATAGSAEEFASQMRAAYPDCAGEENLTAIASKLYPAEAVDRSEANKAAALDFIRLIMEDRDYETARKYVGEYIQHDPRIRDGYDALVDALETNPLWKYRKKMKREFKNVAADGNLVYLQTHREIQAHDDGSPARLAVTHLFRFNDAGKIDEHWTFSQVVKLKDCLSEHPLF